MPGPASLTVTSSIGPDTSAASRIGVPSGVYFAGILEQVVQHALDQRGVELDQRQVARQRDVDRVAGERRLRGLERAADHLLERHASAAQLHLAALDARHVEQVVDQRAHPPRLVGDRLRGVELRTGQRAAGSASAIRRGRSARRAACAGRATAPRAASCAAAPTPFGSAPAARLRRSAPARARSRRARRRCRAGACCSGTSSIRRCSGLIASTPRVRIGAGSGR